MRIKPCGNWRKEADQNEFPTIPSKSIFKRFMFSSLISEIQTVIQILGSTFIHPSRGRWKARRKEQDWRFLLRPSWWFLLRRILLRRIRQRQRLLRMAIRRVYLQKFFLVPTTAEPTSSKVPAGILLRSGRQKMERSTGTYLKLQKNHIQ